VPHIGGNIIAFDDFKNAFQFIGFDTVMKIITESLKIFFFIYDFIRSIAEKTGQFCYCEIGTGSDINPAFNNRIERCIGNITLDRAGPNIGFPFFNSFSKFIIMASFPFHFSFFNIIG
jgi:hypothetical protein